ncbi:thioredoxin domain-containing protein [Leptolyngbya sp. FACHB-711]|uniref:DsbA family protein n=1 Tax=unclassified Leptolyngbya TaxID=2650499 RepID=UPI0016832969|nr:thioredoxin domain-containing protein [Leptolyngbya sp. FACHB-711]MBD1852303.1 DsbA family protein [Cyanobacteria bacterium FACHB-502]MBD2023850.1 DsbA family protein [Leptolyngbya sp. FACHB-711]
MNQDISAESAGDRQLLAVSPSERDHRQGSLNARVVLVEYGDYQCPKSGEIYALIKAIQEQLDSNLKENYLCFVFRHFPQPQLYPQSQKVAAAAEAAGAQGRFWQMSEMLWEHRQDLGDGYLVEYANNLGLNITQFLRDITREVYSDRIKEDIEGGRRSGVTRIPALFINSIRYQNALEFEPLFNAVIESGGLI